MKKFLMAAMLMFSFNAMAIDSRTIDSAGFDKLTDQQKAAVIASVTDTVAKNTGTGGTTAQVANEWLNIGERIGKGFAGAAKELGIAANQFADTPVGKWVAFLIIWHFFGAMAVHLAFGLLFFTAGIFMLRWYYNINREEHVVYSKDKFDIFRRPVIESRKVSDISGETSFALVVGTVVLFGTTTAIVFNGW